jgi:hypothetical protein
MDSGLCTHDQTFSGLKRQLNHLVYEFLRLVCMALEPCTDDPSGNVFQYGDHVLSVHAFRQYRQRENGVEDNTTKYLPGTAACVIASIAASAVSIYGSLDGSVSMP